MRVGIVGNGTDKFTAWGREQAELIISTLLLPDDVLVSGHSPVGGIDIWAEEYAKSIGCELDLKIPEVNRWEGGYGYKARNLDIARDSDVVHVILADTYPAEYAGRRFTLCYHCRTDTHVKSGGCWTGKRALDFGNRAEWHIVNNYVEDDEPNREAL